MIRRSLQWRLTLMTAALVTMACLILNLLISYSAIGKINDIENYMIEIIPNEQDRFVLRMQDLYPALQLQIQQTIDRFHIQSIFATLAVILLSSMLTYFLAGRALKSLRRLGAHMEKVQAQNLSEPLEQFEAEVEIVQLTRSFNEMLARLERAFAIQRQFSANAAHELRTPLAVMRTNLDVLKKRNTVSSLEYTDTLQMMSAQIERLSHLVEVLLEMTELEMAPRNDHISLSVLIEEVLCDLAQIAQQKQITLRQEPGEAVLQGSDLLLYRAVYNLVENAVKYNKPNGTVTVGACMEDDLAVLRVVDTGIGIPLENWTSIFHPFVRVEKSRSRMMGGAGLGLSLVQNIVALHHGSVYVAKSSAAGTEMIMKLPAAASAMFDEYEA